MIQTALNIVTNANSQAKSMLSKAGIKDVESIGDYIYMETIAEDLQKVLGILDDAEKPGTRRFKLQVFAEAEQANSKKE